MGTSQSGKGPGGGVVFVPPWTPAAPAAGDGNEDGAADGTPPANPPVAPHNRFGSTKAALGRFARDGKRSDLQRAVGHYISRGYGGAGTATRRAGGTIATAGAFNAALSALSSGAQDATGGPLDRELLATASARDIINRIVEEARPVDGTIDSETERASINDALSEVLERFPDANLLALDDEARIFAVECFAAIDVFRRFCMDAEEVIVGKAPTSAVAAERLNDARDYIRQHIAASFKKLADDGRQMTARTVNTVVRDALADAFKVFEDYIR